MLVFVCCFALLESFLLLLVLLILDSYPCFIMCHSGDFLSLRCCYAVVASWTACGGIKSLIGVHSCTGEKNERLLLDILELNTIFKGSANYELQIFRRMPGQEENLIPLKFTRDGSVSEAIFTGVRPPGTEGSLEGTDVTIGEEYPTAFCGYFFHIHVVYFLYTHKPHPETPVYP